MKTHFLTIAPSIVLAFGVMAAPCQAQLQNVTVQLPTYHYFGVSTTVSVPDRGGVHLGGVNRSNYGRRQWGRSLPTIDSRATASGVSLHATIIDHHEIDRALLAEAARRRGARFDVSGRPVAAPKVPRDIVAQRWRSTR